jgi:hypothetical protein
VSRSGVLFLRWVALNDAAPHFLSRTVYLFCQRQTALLRVLESAEEGVQCTWGDIMALGSDDE